MFKEEAAYALADAFIKEYRRFDFKFPSIKTIQKSKWWGHFLKAAELRYIEDWNPNLWIKCQFEKNGKILPFQIYGKQAESTFNEFKDKFLTGKEDQQKQMINGMLQTHNKINKQYEIFFNDKNNIMNIKRKQYSLYYLSICRTFRNLNKIENIFDEKILNLKRSAVITNHKLTEKLKSVMSDEFY